MTPVSIMVGVPVFEGWDVVGETLQSIRDQQYSNFRVLISVDGADERSRAACEPFLADPRFQLVMQPRLLGWEENMTWLGRQLAEDFFCYWQHDDVCAPDYLRKLAAHAARHPEASAVYCDMQHFGAADSLLVYPSVTGFALQRVLSQIERNGPAPIRCLVRADAMRAALPIVQVGQWAVTLAAAGELHRVPEALYRRRVRPDSLSIKMRSGGPAQARAGTPEWGVSVFLAGLPAIPPQDAPRLLLFVADQLVNHRPRRNYHFDMAAAGSDGRLRFLSEFLREVHDRCGVIAFPELLKGNDAAARLAERLTLHQEPEVEALVIKAMLADLPQFLG